MADKKKEDETFQYEDPRTGKIAPRPVKPKFWDKVRENLQDTAAVDVQRAKYKAARGIEDEE